MREQLRELDRMHEPFFDEQLTEAAAIRALEDEHLLQIYGGEGWLE